MAYNSLCAECTRNSEREDLFPDRLWTVRDIAVWAQHCPYCAIIWNSVNAVFANDPTIGAIARTEDDKIRVWEPFGGEGGSSARRDVTYEWVGSEKTTGIELSVFRMAGGAWEAGVGSEVDAITKFLRRRIPIRFEIPSSTGSRASIEQTKSWIDDCLKNHQPACQPLLYDTLRPTRLVRIRKVMDTYHVNLVEPQQEVEYFCLSHRWGTGPTPWKTTSENVNQRKNGIPWDELPNIFRQALEFTHELGVEYLWIDSLCIVQGSDGDWSNESGKMASIYGKAKLTIAASVAENNEGQLFHTSPPSETGVLVEGLQAVEVAEQIFVRKMPEHRLELFPLLSRAWAYQERLLSPRYLHFSPTELIWECNSETVCMCSGRDIASARGLGEKIHDRFAKKLFWRSIVWNEQEKCFRIKEEWKGFPWNSVVEAYSYYQLTRRSDRLPAISGMAKQFRHLGQRGDYLAGLWRDTFLDNMMWRASSRSASMSRSSPSVEPTWSWCSVGAGVSYFGDPWIDLEVSERSRLLDASCEPLFEDDTLNLKSASVTLQGPTFTATLQSNSDNGARTKYTLNREGVKPGKLYVDYDIAEPGDGHIECGSEVFCVEGGDVLIYGDDGFGMHALVFRKLENGKFERIGVVEWEEDIRPVSAQAEIATLIVV